MRVLLLAALFLLLAGCAAPAAVEPPSPATPQPASVVTFRGNDTLAAEAGPAPVDLFSTGRPGSEPSVGVTPKGDVFVVAYEQTLRSKDGGRTWEDVLNYSNYYPAEPTGFLGSNDPYLHVDARTGRVFTDHMQLLTCTNLLWSDDAGSSWSRHDQACGSPVVDFPKVATAKPGPAPNPLAGVAYPDVVYLCYNKGAEAAYTTSCAVSYDGGLTFPLERQALAMAYVPQANVFAGSCAGGASAPADAPDGTVFLVGCGGFGAARSRDSGLTWEALAPPRDAPTMGASVPFAAFGRDGTLYLLTVGQDGRAYLHVSRDQGDSWGPGLAVSPPGVAPVSFPTILAGAKGRVAVGFLGVRGNGTNPERVNATDRWHLFVVTTDDALAQAPAFRAVQATPDADPVQVGPICLGGASCRDARNLGDFIGSAAGPDGTPYVVFADGCVPPCASAKESRSSTTTLAVLRGWSLSP